MADFPYQRVHLCGIGGAGVSGLARLLIEMGVKVTGSDAAPSAVTAALQELGAKVYHTEHPDNLDPTTDLLVHSAAIRPWHPERRQAAILGIPELKYAQCLGQLTGIKDTIAIAGTHGKTSTTNLISTLLLKTGRNPGWVVGGVPQNLPASARWGNGQHFVVEACEYDHSFLNFSPAMAVLHNIEPDHIDYFRSFAGVKRAFRAFVARTRSDGVLFANWDDSSVREIADACRRRVVRYGFCEEATYRPENLSFNEGFARFTLCQGRRELVDIRLPAPGKTNIINAVAAASVALFLGATPDAVAEILEAPIGVKRRFELLARVKGVPILDDYAHHPTAVRELAVAARAAFPNKKITFVFQAHQYGRLNGFFNEFVDALTGLDRVMICRTYAARELGVVPGVPEEKLASSLRARGVDAVSYETFGEVVSALRNNWRPDMAVFSVGAGDVNQIAYELAGNSGSYSGSHQARPSASYPSVPAIRPIEPQTVSSLLRTVDAFAAEVSPNGVPVGPGVSARITMTNSARVCAEMARVAESAISGRTNSATSTSKEAA